MKAGRLLSLIAGLVLALPASALLLTGGGLGGGYLLERDEDGYVSDVVAPLESPTAALTVSHLALVADLGTPQWLLERLDADVRIEVTPAASSVPVFVGIGPAGDVDGYLAGVAHDEVVDADGDDAAYRRVPGRSAVGAPVAQSLWVESASGDGSQRIDWAVSEGRWSVVLMNADGSAGIAGTTTVGVKAGFVLPLALLLLGTGAVLAALAVLLIVVGLRGQRADGRRPAGPAGRPDGPSWSAPLFPPAGLGETWRPPVDQPVARQRSS